jgi:flagellar basal-body rod protein FlgB
MHGKVFRVDLLARTLDAASLRHRAIAANIANVNTPGYSRVEVAFEEDLAARLRDGEVGDIGQVQPRVVEAAGGAVRADGNNVSLEQEMTDLAKNTLLYNTAAQLLATQLAIHRSAVS